MWPPAAAFAQFHLPGKPATSTKPYYTVTRLDPKQLRPTDDATTANVGLVPLTGAAALPFEITRNGHVHSNNAPATLTQTGCVDKDGMLVLLEPPANAVQDEAGLLALLTHLSCVTPLADVRVVRVVLPHLVHKAQPAASVSAQPVSVPPHGSASGAALPPAVPPPTMWFTHEALTGAKRVFTDTPVLPPTKWAYVQARAVPFGPSSVTPRPPVTPLRTVVEHKPPPEPAPPATSTPVPPPEHAHTPHASHAVHPSQAHAHKPHQPSPAPAPAPSALAPTTTGAAPASQPVPATPAPIGAPPAAVAPATATQAVRPAPAPAVSAP